MAGSISAPYVLYVQRLYGNYVTIRVTYSISIQVDGGSWGNHKFVWSLSDLSSTLGSRRVNTIIELQLSAELGGRQVDKMVPTLFLLRTIGVKS
jgi:hypothetical protein